MGKRGNQQTPNRSPRIRRTIKRPVQDYDEIISPAHHNNQSVDQDVDVSNDAVPNSATSTPGQVNIVWNSETKVLYEVMVGLALSASEVPVLTTDQICKKIAEMFPNAIPTGNIRFARRLQNLMGHSEFIEFFVDGNATGDCLWHMVFSKKKAFQEHLDKFLENNSNLAAAHGIQNTDHYRLGRKRVSEASSCIGEKKKRKVEQAVEPRMKSEDVPAIVLANSPASTSAYQATGKMVPSLKRILPTWNRHAKDTTLHAKDITLHAKDITLHAKDTTLHAKDTTLIDSGDLLKTVNEAVNEAVKQRDDAQSVLLDSIGARLKAIEEKEDKANRLFEIVKAIAENAAGTKTIRLVDASANTESADMQHNEGEEQNREDAEQMKLDELDSEDNEVQVNLKIKKINHEELGEIYTTLALVGVGSFGEVYRARDTRKGIFAIKLTDLEDLTDTSMTAQDELELLMNRHQQDGEQLPRFLARSQSFKACVNGCLTRCEKMELYDMDLFKAIKDHGMTFRPLQVLQTICQMSSALEYLHKHHFIHCDIKLDNIMFAQFEHIDGKPLRIDTRLIDLNVVIKAEQQPLLFTAQSAQYRAPEMALEMPCSNKIDMWSLGLVAAQMISGPAGFHLLTGEDLTNLSEFETNLAILGEIQHLIEPIPDDMIRQSSIPRLQMVTGFPRMFAGQRLTLKHVLCSVEMDFISRPLLQIVFRMLRVDPAKRPSAAHIAEKLAPINI